MALLPRTMSPDPAADGAPREVEPASAATPAAMATAAAFVALRDRFFRFVLDQAMALLPRTMSTDAAADSVTRDVEPADAATPAATATAAAFVALRDRFFRSVLDRYPVVSTFLGGDGWDVRLADANGRLRDSAPAAISEELAFYRDLERDLRGIDRTHLDAGGRVDSALLAAQLAFLVHQIDDLRYRERAVDTYVAEPFRGLDWQIQQMGPLDGSGGPPDAIGSDEEWRAVVARLRSVPGYVDAAIDDLVAGLASGNVPDRRMVDRDGIPGSRADAQYLRSDVPGLAASNLRHSGERARILADVVEVAERAAAAFDRFATFLEEAAWPPGDRFAIGEPEYAWRLRNNLRIDQTPAELWEFGREQVAAYRERLFGVAGEIGREHSLGLRFGTDAERAESVSAVIAELGRDAPRDDDERLSWYVDSGRRAVEYGRTHALFDVPDDYRLDVVPTPPLLRSTLEAAYYPAAPFKQTGVGRFYLTPTGNDPEALRLNGRASIATVAVHEGFPGHDWHYRTMADHGEGISNIRWLTPGAVEDSSSMWSDSMSIEGWGLYAEQLMGDAVDGSERGFYSLEDEFYYLYWNLRRALRVQADVGLHTGRLSFDQAVDWWAAEQDFAPQARSLAASDPTMRSILEAAEKNIYRYSKWPTQAITYSLGRASIVGLRDTYLRRRSKATRRAFHEWYLGIGTVPAGYLGELI